MGMDLLQSVSSASIISVSADGTSVQLDQPLQVEATATWTVQGVPATVSPLAPCGYLVDTDLLLCPGQKLEQTQLLATPAAIHAELRRRWQSRWGKAPDLGPALWDRISTFMVAYLPQRSLTLPALDPSLWQATVAKFTARSARRCDGFDYADLQRMPLSLQQHLLSLLSTIEDTGHWPKQLLAGLLHGLPKHEAASEAKEFRPTLIYSQVFRAWSSLRASQILAYLSPLMDCNSGCLPRPPLKKRCR